MLEGKTEFSHVEAGGEHDPVVIDTANRDTVHANKDSDVEAEIDPSLERRITYGQP